MELNGTEKYFTIEYENGRVQLISRGLDGSAFLIRNWDGLERLTLNGRFLRRTHGIKGSFCVYQEEPQQKQVQA